MDKIQISGYILDYTGKFTRCMQAEAGTSRMFTSAVRNQ